MSLKNLSAIKIPRILKNKLSNKRLIKLFNIFERNFDVDNSFIVAVSGGSDSLALSFLTKIYSIKNRVKSYYFIVDHNLRKESKYEAKKVKKILDYYNIKSEILTWHGKKPQNNIQSLARKKRYELLFSKCKKLKVKNLVIGHHIDDLFENFFIRMIRGSGLKGLVSLGKKKTIDNVNLIRPLLYFNKKDLEFISNHVFNFFVKDPSNKDIKYKRIKIRNIIQKFEDNGLDKNKLSLTIRNLKKSNNAISFYVDENKKLNSFLRKNNEILILKDHFFNHPYEVVFRSFSDSIKLIGNKSNAVRGKKIDYILDKIRQNCLKKETLGGCVIKKVNQTVIISKEY
tara:strand:+ start:507 stop:1532 length:1026 start_codon:yes stop_codon:yes gene_type:complete